MCHVHGPVQAIAGDLPDGRKARGQPLALVLCMDTRAQTVRDVRNSRLSQTLGLGLLVIVLLISFGLRVHRLGDKSVWWDEGYSTWLARQSFVEIAQGTSRDTHPPLYFWLLHLWREGSSDSEFGLRFLSASVGLLTVVVTYCLGRAVGNRLIGLLAALLVGISPFHIWWSQEVRMYAPAALLAALTLWAALRVWDRGRLVDWVLYVFFATAGLYTLYLNVLVLVIINLAWLWVFWRADHRLAVLVRWFSAQMVIVLLFAPWLIYALGRIPTWSAASPVSSDVFLKIYWTVLTTGIPCGWTGRSPVGLPTGSALGPKCELVAVVLVSPTRGGIPAFATQRGVFLYAADSSTLSGDSCASLLRAGGVGDE